MEQQKKGDRPPGRIEADTLKNDPEDADVRSPPNEGELHLPHERDESFSAEDAQGPRQVIEQAASDLRRGLRNTDRFASPDDIPTPGVPPEESPGAEVPEDGVNRTKYGKHQETGPKRAGEDEPGNRQTAERKTGKP